MKFEERSNRRLILKNSALVIGGLFVSGKIIAQVAPPAGVPGSPTQPSMPNNQQSTPSQGNPNPTGNTGLYQQNYPTETLNGANQNTNQNNNRKFSNTYSGGYYGSGGGYYGTGYYSTGYYGTSYR